MTQLNIRLFIITLSCFGSALLLNAQSFELTLKIENLEEVEGVMQIGLFEEESDFLEIGKEFQVKTAPIDSIVVFVIFNDIPKGTYAISLYQDLNRSGDIDKNFIGIPQEPYGISNDAWRRFAAPQWEDASFAVTKDTTIIVNLRN